MNVAPARSSTPGTPFTRSASAWPITDRAAMVWAADNTPRKSRFLVVPTAPSAAQEPIGEQDWVSEWFPALTGRRSVATVQGREWLPDFAETVSSDDKLSVCAQRDAACLDSWASKSGRSFDYVYLPKAASADGAQCCW